MSAYPCGHESQIADKFRAVTRPDGTTERERVPQRFIAKANPVYCNGCGQIVEGEHFASDAERHQVTEGAPVHPWQAMIIDRDPGD